jgi:anti-sigma B factor antagonist
MIHDLRRMFPAGYDTPLVTYAVVIKANGISAMTSLEAHVPSFHLEPITADDCAVLRVTGEVDVHTAPELRQQVIKLVESGTRHVVADLSGVDFLDSSGLGVLVGGLKRLRLQQGSLTIVTSVGAILQLLEVTGLSRAFTVYPTVLDAIAAAGPWDAALAGGSAEEWCREHGLA